MFATDNPFLLDTDSESKGRELFRRGVLTGGRWPRGGGGPQRVQLPAVKVPAWCAASGGRRSFNPAPSVTPTYTPISAWLPACLPAASEAVLALEAECQRSPSNAEAWRLLGTVQAENDDDQQAIAAMNR